MLARVIVCEAHSLCRDTRRTGIFQTMDKIIIWSLKVYALLFERQDKCIGMSDIYVNGYYVVKMQNGLMATFSGSSHNSHNVKTPHLYSTERLQFLSYSERYGS
jgi:hypothetical protein